MDPKLERYYRGRWLAGMKSFASVHGEIVMAVVIDDDEVPRAVSRWRLGRDMVPDIGETIDRAIRDPIEGRPHLPAIVRVADQDLADALQAARPEVRVEIGPTAAIEPVMADIAKELEDDEKWQWLGGDVDPAIVGALCTASQAFLSGDLWEELELDQIIRVQLPGLDLFDIGVHLSSEGSITGGRVVSIAIAPSRAAREAWLDDGVPEEEIDVFFYDRDDLPEAAWQEIRQHGWVGSPEGQYPRVVAGGPRERPATNREVMIARSVVDALAVFFDDEARRDNPTFGRDGIEEAEVTLASGDIAKVRIDPLELLPSHPDDDDGDEESEEDIALFTKELEEDDAFLELDDENHWPAAPKAASATVRAVARPGRNDECWCGSGKKYKKCHLDEDAAKART